MAHSTLKRIFSVHDKVQHGKTIFIMQNLFTLLCPSSNVTKRYIYSKENESLSLTGWFGSPSTNKIFLDMVRLKPSLICVVLMVFLRRNQVSSNQSFLWTDDWNATFIHIAFYTVLKVVLACSYDPNYFYGYFFKKGWPCFSFCWSLILVILDLPLTHNQNDE